MLQYELPLRGFREDASILPDGTPSGTRTLDTLIKSQVLYQLSYSPVFHLVDRQGLEPRTDRL